MAYEKQEWKCGDTITADKMNHIEEGIEDASDKGYECTEGWTTLTEETVTTVVEDDYPGSTLAYTTLIDADTIKVTFNGVQYECNKREGLGGTVEYGAPFADGYDFSQYPFNIYSESGSNFFVTQTAGTYTIKIEALEESVTITPCFQKAVESIAKGGKIFTNVAEGTCGNNTYVEYNITYNDFINARNNGSNVVYISTDANELRARNIVAFNCIDGSGWYGVQAIYANIIENPAPTASLTPLILFCNTTDGYMRDVNCWRGIN